MKQKQNMKQPNMTFYLIVAWTDTQTERHYTAKPTSMTRQTDQGAKRATDAQELAEGATYLSIQNELHVSSKTISKIKKQM